MENTLILFACGFLGVLVHCLFKANDLIEYAHKANIDFEFKDYLKKDWFGISISILAVVIWYLIFGEVGAKYPKIIDFIRCTFILMGWFGSYIAQKLFSKAKSFITNIIDKKTNIADAVVMDDPDGDPIAGGGQKNP